LINNRFGVKQMACQNRYQGMDVYAEKVVRIKAKQLVDKYGFISDDKKDIEQELMFDLWCKLPQFDPSKSQKQTFISRLVDRKIADIVKAKGEQCRDWRLSEPIEDPADDDCSDNGIKPDHENCDSQRDGRLQVDLAYDLSKVLSELSGDTIQLCQQLKKDTISDVSKINHITRIALYRKLERVKRCCKNAGLEKYLEHF
jgi:DNA-directed RNA polymerase specialized sigma24 family protein